MSTSRAGDSTTALGSPPEAWAAIWGCCRAGAGWGVPQCPGSPWQPLLPVLSSLPRDGHGMECPRVAPLWELPASDPCRCLAWGGVYPTFSLLGTACCLHEVLHPVVEGSVSLRHQIAVGTQGTSVLGGCVRHWKIMLSPHFYHKTQ